MKNLYLLECPSNLGLKAPHGKKEPGVKYLPDWLRQHGFHGALGAEKVVKLPAPAYSAAVDQETRMLNAPSIVAYSTKVAETVADIVQEKKFPVILGGDCSILIGIALGLKQKGNFGLFYLDGHTDFMDISLSETGGAGGMVASLVAGRGHEKLANIKGLSPYIEEENVWCVGNSEYDPVYEQEILNSNATYISLKELRNQSITKCVQAFLQSAQSKKLDGVWLHIDVDVLDDAVMPCVDSRAPGGLTFSEFNELVSQLLESQLLAGFDVTILDPELDPIGEYTQEFVHQLTTLLKGKDNKG